MTRSTGTTGLDSRARKRLRERLVDWYVEASRSLPWRCTADPYAIWISEAMLQQTRVETVVDYWKRFLERLPTVEALAAAEEEDVLALWSGLGYYRRARSLHAAAQRITEEHGGEFPRTLKAALDLPGVGPYTAAAVLSIAYDEPEALVDGNVMRVFARRFGIEERLGDPALEKRSWAFARELVPTKGAGTWNQALMELGATVCTPKSPRCEACPWSRGCVTKGPELPLPKKKAETIEVRLELLLMEKGGKVLLEQRPSGGHMSGMWQVPTREETSSGLFPGQYAAAPQVGEEVGELRHSITRHRIQGRIRRATLPGRPPAEWRWFPLESLSAVPLTGMTKKVLRRVQG